MKPLVLQFFLLSMNVLTILCGAIACSSHKALQPDMKVVCHEEIATLYIPDAAVATHLNHGDYHGPCTPKE